MIERAVESEIIIEGAGGSPDGSGSIGGWKRSTADSKTSLLSSAPDLTSSIFGTFIYFFLYNG